MEKKIQNTLIFQETFDSSLNGLPGGWYVERNSDLKEVPAIRRGEKCIEFLSAGNKYLPIIPDVTDFQLKSSFSFSIKAGRLFCLLISFGYDTVTGRGQALRIFRGQNAEKTSFEIGTMRANIFTATEKKEFSMEEDIFNHPFDLEMEVKGNLLSIDTLGVKTSFKIKKSSGAIAVSRDHFYDILKLTKMEIYAPSTAKGKKIASFTVSMPADITFYPIYCDVVLTDYGTCLDASLKFHGSSQETEAGEGTYHGMRSDVLLHPYLKVLTREKIEKYVIFDRKIFLCVQSLVKPHFYERLCEKVPWPFIRNVRFMKPEGKFDLAIGADTYIPSTLRDMVQSPSETIFDLKGNVLYSGQGFTEEKIKCEFLSQEKKKTIALLPKSDPRYDKAVEFQKNNHFFLEKEDALFKIRLTGKEFLPSSFEVYLEDAFFRPVKKLKCKVSTAERTFGVSSFPSILLEVEKISSLSCGVYHLRVKSTDAVFPAWEEYCAFEVLSTAKESLCPPLASGLPYIYNGRTETRGLLTDGFDVWMGKSTDLPHYHSCANFLPKAARDFDVMPTVKALGRENFLWLGTRCADDPLPEHNLDLIAKSDYVNVCEYLNQFCALWRHTYGGKRLEKLYKFVKETKDPDFDLKSMEKSIKAWKKAEKTNGIWDYFAFKDFLSEHNYKILTEKYWEEYLDMFNKDVLEEHRAFLKEMKKVNPKLKFSMYGPAAIYAAHLKGAEFSRYVGCDCLTEKEMGFWQYEDYPYACRYGLERGSYYMASHLMNHPGARVYPEIYTAGGGQGCPDGAVFYAHPPMGVRPIEYPNRMIRQTYEFSFATGHFRKDGFHFWENKGFQACGFSRAWFKTLLTAWRAVADYIPERPLCSPAFVTSNGSRRAHERMLYSYGNIIDVRNTASEDVPYIYEQTRQHQLCNGFQVMEENLMLLTPADTNVLVLPPLKGMKKETLKHIRKLHEKGVGLLACEDVTGLEDLFGVKNTGKKKTITKVIAAKDFCNGGIEICDDERCVGSYVADGAEVLLDAEIPVLTIKKNGRASAAFFNVAPHLVKEDRLHLRLGYGKDGISDLVSDAVAEVIKLLSTPEVTADNGRLIACKAKSGETLVFIGNEDDDNAKILTVNVKKAPGRNKLVKCDKPCTAVNGEKGYMTYRIALEAGDAAVMVFK